MHLSERVPSAMATSDPVGPIAGDAALLYLVTAAACLLPSLSPTKRAPAPSGACSRRPVATGVAVAVIAVLARPATAALNSH